MSKSQMVQCPLVIAPYQLKIFLMRRVWSSQVGYASRTFSVLYSVIPAWIAGIQKPGMSKSQMVQCPLVIAPYQLKIFLMRRVWSSQLGYASRTFSVLNNVFKIYRNFFQHIHTASNGRGYQNKHRLLDYKLKLLDLPKGNHIILWIIIFYLELYNMG
ncbi:hypothetical protein TI04_01340 [Achromatium sp. WMS2]|nr:hypothetical protein TI04_01340 [Achromatium sp. WMS2]